MEIGAAIFFTDYSMAPTELAVALEERGFNSLWVAEHLHIPVTRRFSHPLGDAALTKEYYDVMDPFVTLSAAAVVTTRLKLGTAVCLVIQRDTIQTACSGDCDQPFRPKVITDSGDRDHAVTRPIGSA